MLVARDGVVSVKKLFTETLPSFARHQTTATKLIGNIDIS